MAEPPARPPLDWSGNAPFPFTRESTIRIDADGHFWHEGVRVDHPGLANAMATWVSKHPTNGRWVLENGWDWCYIQVDDVPLLVRAARVDRDGVRVTLSDGSEEKLDPAGMTVDGDGVIRCTVHPSARGGPYPAKFTRHAQLAVVDRLEEDEQGQFLLRTDGAVIPLRHA